MFLKLVLLSSFLIAISLLAMGLRIIFVKGGKFPQTSIGKNKEMQKLGITCVKHDEMKCYRDMKKDGDGSGGCCC